LLAGAGQFAVFSLTAFAFLKGMPHLLFNRIGKEKAKHDVCYFTIPNSKGQTGFSSSFPV
jgi:hypothetical protein